MISQEQFNQAKLDLSGKDPLVKRVKLSDIIIDDNSIKHNAIEIEGSRVPVSNKFFNRLGPNGQHQFRSDYKDEQEF